MNCKYDCDCGSFCPRGGVFFGILFLLLGASLVAGIASFVGELSQTIALPRVTWLPLSAVAIGGTVWGLWLGFKHHGRAEPLTVGVFGLLTAAVGFVSWYPIVLLGAAIVLGAAVWGAATTKVRRET